MDQESRIAALEARNAQLIAALQRILAHCGPAGARFENAAIIQIVSDALSLDNPAR